VKGTREDIVLGRCAVSGVLAAIIFRIGNTRP
jgi:hypothetical protein